MICKKCDSDKCTVRLRQKDFYCEQCFITNTNHKFRACIGKYKLFSAHENVLVGLSGGPGSSVLLDLIYNGLCLENHKKIRITPHFIHLYDSDKNTAESIIKQCEKHGFALYVAPLSDYTLETIDLPEVNSLSKWDPDTSNLTNLLKNVPPTVFNDLLPKIKRTLYIRYANMLDCKYIFTAETTMSLATNLLSSIALGRGCQVEDDVGFIDNRDKIKIMRPMKDISEEELHYYIKIKKLDVQQHNKVQKNSLQYLINNFVSDLQENFPSTISTVCKTANKLGVFSVDDDNKLGDRCKICKSVFNNSSGKLTALQATDFSSLVSLQTPLNLGSNDVIETVQRNQSSMFPHINDRLCYSCSRNYSEAKGSDFIKKSVLKNVHELLPQS